MTRGRLLALALMIGACQHAPAPHAVTAWRWAAPAPAYVGMPAAAGNDAFATYGHSVLVAVDGATGRIRWRAQRVGLRDVAPAATPGRVLAATDDGLIAYARDDGRPLWEVALGQRPSTPVVIDTTTFVTTWEGQLIAVDQWAVDLPGPSLGPPAGAHGVVVASWDGGVVAVDAATGRIRWRRGFAGAGTSAPAVAHGVAVVVGGDRRVHAYELQSGRERWSATMPGAGSPEAPPAMRRGLVAVTDRLGHLVVFDLVSGRRRWRADGRGAVERGGPVFAGDAVALALDDGRLMVASSGHHEFRDPPGRVSGLAAHGGRVFVATRDAASNHLTALDTSPGKSTR